jgi:hypothetical protein
MTLLIASFTNNKMTEKQKGLYRKYTVTKVNGPTEPNARYFVLRLDKDPHAQKAALAYADSIREENRNLAFDLYREVHEVKQLLNPESNETEGSQIAKD